MAYHKQEPDPDQLTPTDREYFDSYGFLDIHRTMIDDEERTGAYRRAILTNYPLFYGKTVLDVGCGTGILSVFCCQAGARRVYAVEASSAAGFARRVAAENGYGERVTVLESRLEDVQLPEQVDVIVSEWMGHALLYESMLDTVLLARDRWLRPGGALFPETAVLKVALTTAPADDAADFWRGVYDRYRVRMASLAAPAAAAAYRAVRVQAVLPEEVHSLAATVAELDLRSAPAEEARAIRSAPLRLASFGQALCTGLVLWFDVRFPGGLVLTTSPYGAETHWSQALLPLPSRAVQQDWCLSGRLSLRQSPACRRNWEFAADLTLSDAAGAELERREHRWVMDGAS